MDAVTLRQATEADIPAYIALDKKSMSKTYHGITEPEKVRAEFTKGPVYMIEFGGKVAGMVSYDLSQTDGRVEVSGMVVDPQYRGKGIARTAMANPAS